MDNVAHPDVHTSSVHARWNDANERGGLQSEYRQAISSRADAPMRLGIPQRTKVKTQPLPKACLCGNYAVGRSDGWINFAFTGR